MQPDITFNLIELKRKARNKIDMDNIRFYDNLVKSCGKLYTLDKRPYVKFLCDLNVNFTAKV